MKIPVIAMNSAVYDDEKQLIPILTDSVKNYNQIHFFKTGTSIYKVDLSMVDYILAYGNYSKIVMPNKQLTVGDTLKEIEELLNEKEFIRIHRSCIVSIKKIEKIKDNIVYINNINLPVGKLYREEFFNRILQF